MIIASVRVSQSFIYYSVSGIIPSGKRKGSNYIIKFQSYEKANNFRDKVKKGEWSGLNLMNHNIVKGDE
jgi:hypothetical protein